MAFKLIIFSTLLALAKAGNLLTTHYASPLPHVTYAAPLAKVAAPVAYAAPTLAKHIEDDYDPHPQYSYSYDVQDSLTGDNKQQSETRDGDSVHGSYSFIEADGSRRIVEYTADPINGFNAVVHKEPAAASLAPVAGYSQPILKTGSYPPLAPLAYTPYAKIATSLH